MAAGTIWYCVSSFINDSETIFLSITLSIMASQPKLDYVFIKWRINGLDYSAHLPGSSLASLYQLIWCLAPSLPH